MKLVSAVLLLLGLFFSSFGQTRKENTIKSIDTYLSNLEKVGFDGSVLVALEGEILVSKGYGYCNKEQKIKNAPNTVFDIGSITKQFTAAVILKLESQGKLTTDDKITKYFENLPDDKGGITIHDLLRHQSGLISNVGKDYENISEGEFLEKVFASKLKFEPATNFSYSNIGYSLLTMIIEKISLQPYETYLYENLLKPAGMEATAYSRLKFDSKIIAVGYYDNDSVWGKPTEKEWDQYAPYWHLKGNGGLLSTTEDLYKWHQCLMTDRVLSESGRKKLYNPKLRPGESNTSYYAYGWNISRTDSNTTTIWHNGTNRIFYADFLRFLDDEITIIMLSNKSHPNFNNLSFEISRIIYNPDFNPEIPVADNPENRNLTNRILQTIKKSGLDKAKQEYAKRKASEQLLEFFMRQEGFNLIDNQQPEIALQVFEMNVHVYPNSAKALQGLGEGYLETGKKDLALKYFKQSLNINPDNPFVKRMMTQLEDKKQQ